MSNRPVYWGSVSYNYVFKYKKFDLKPHPYLNLAYYFTSDLKPIAWSSISSLKGFETIADIFAFIAEENDHIQFQTGVQDGESLLTRDGELVGAVETMALFTICFGWLRVEEVKVDIIHVETGTEHVDDTTVFDGFAQLALYRLGKVTTFVAHQCLLLGSIDE